MQIENEIFMKDKFSPQEFDLKYGYDPSWLQPMLEIFNKTEMKRDKKRAAKINQAFLNSQVVTSCWLDSKLVAIGRMITDFEMYSAIFDVVVDPGFQKQNLGRKLMIALIEKAPETCIHLTSTFGNEAFYHKLGFRFHKTAMALYPERFGQTPYLDWEKVPNSKS